MGALPIELALLLGAIFLLLCVLASKLSARLGVPALVLFIVIGMLAGSQGSGKIRLEDFKLAKELGMVLLGFILFSGGMDTSWKIIQPIAARGMVLSTLGVCVTAGLVGLFAHYALGFTLLEGLLLGSIVSSTDAAAIFSVLRSRGLVLKHRLGPLLEFESGTNDPFAVFLTLGIARAMTSPETTLWSLVPSLLWQMPVGALVGIALAKGTVWLINHLRLEYDGLYTVVTMACAAAAYGTAHLVGGNEFLAVYIAGLTLGSSVFLHKIGLTQFHDGLAWLLQIGVFLALGLLAIPKQVMPVAAGGLILALFLMFIARPVAVFTSLAFARMTKRSRLFLSWAGLRGAFPIILGTVPVISGVDPNLTMFHLVFFVVVVSVLVQGTTLRPLGLRLGVIAERHKFDDLLPATHTDLLEIVLTDGSPAAGKQVVEIGLPTTALLVLLKRDGESYIPRGATILKPGDVLLVATRREDQEELRMRLAG